MYFKYLTIFVPVFGLAQETFENIKNSYVFSFIFQYFKEK